MEFTLLISHEVVIILKKVGIFSRLSYNQLIELSNVTEEIEIPCGNHIFKEKEMGSDLLIIVNGKVGLTCDGKDMGELEPYSLLDELSKLDDTSHLVTATALSVFYCLELNQMSFMSYLKTILILLEPLWSICAQSSVAIIKT